MKLYRAFFEKKDEAIYISHLDLQRVMMRAVKKAGLPVWYTEGFNPHIYMTFALPLSLGQASLCESFDFKSDDLFDFEEGVTALNMALPSGVKVTKIAEAIMKPSDIASADYSIFYSAQKEDVLDAISAFQMLQETFVTKVSKKKGSTQVDIKPYVQQLTVSTEENGVDIHVHLPTGTKLNINPALFCTFLENAYKLSQTDADITRLAIYNTGKELFV